jgi:histidine phosphotransferase ChpT
MIGTDPLPKPAVKIILNLSLLLVDALVRGGRLDIGCEKQGEGSIEIALHVEAERIFLDADVERILAEGEGASPMTSRTAPAVLVQAVARQNDGTVMLARETPTSLLVGAVLRGRG